MSSEAQSPDHGPEKQPRKPGKGEGARVTHIKSRRFVPRAPEEVSEGPPAPVSTGVEPLATAPSIAEESVPAYVPQEPAIEHIETGGIPLKVKIGAALGGLVTVLGGIVGYDRLNSSSDDGKVDVVIPPAPTQNIETPQPQTQIPTPEPTAVITPEPIDSRAKEEALKIFERYYLPVNKESVTAYGGVSFGIAESVYNRTSCTVNGASKRDCPIKQLYANPEFPDSKERIQDAYERWGFYNAWVNLRENKLPSQNNLLPKEGESEEEKQNKRNEFWDRVQSGEDFRFPITGYGESGPETFGKERWVNPKLGIGKLALPSINGTLIHVTADLGINYSTIDERLIIGTYDGASEGQVYKDRSGQEHRLSVGAAATAEWEIVLLGDAPIMKQLKTQGFVAILNHKQYEDKQIAVQKILAPNWQNLPYNEWRSVLISR